MFRTLLIVRKTHLLRTAQLFAAAALSIASLLIPVHAEGVDKAFGPWRVTCVEPKGERRTCALMVGVINKKKVPIFRWVIGPDEEAKSGNTIAISTLTGVLVANGITVRFDQGKPVLIPYQLCMPAFCAAELPFTEAWLKSLKSSKRFSITINASSGREIKYEISLEQFSSAYDFYYSESAKN